MGLNVIYSVTLNFLKMKETGWMDAHCSDTAFQLKGGQSTYHKSRNHGFSVCLCHISRFFDNFCCCWKLLLMLTKIIWVRSVEFPELLEFCVCFNAGTEELDYILQLCHLIWLKFSGWSAYMGPVLIREDFSPLLLQEDEVLSGLPANRALQHLHRFCSSVLKGGFLCGILSDHWVLLCPWSIQPQWRKLWPRGQRWLWKMLWQGRLWYITVQVSDMNI